MIEVVILLHDNNRLPKSREKSNFRIPFGSLWPFLNLGSSYGLRASFDVENTVQNVLTHCSNINDGIRAEARARSLSRCLEKALCTWFFVRIKQNAYLKGSQCLNTCEGCYSGRGNIITISSAFIGSDLECYARTCSCAWVCSLFLMCENILRGEFRSKTAMMQNNCGIRLATWAGLIKRVLLHVTFEMKAARSNIWDDTHL